MTLPRRDLLKGAGALVVGFALLPRNQAAVAMAKSVSPEDVGAFIAIDNQGVLTLYSGKVELGTGALTALTQIMAEELSLPMNRVKAVQGDTQLTPDQGPTYSSLTIQDGGMQIRRAAATAREALLDRAAHHLKVAKAQLSIDNGVVKSSAGGAGVSYAQLVGSSQLNLQVDPRAPLKNPKDYTIVGKPIARLDIPAKVFGTFDYVQDVRVPGMLHARMVHPKGVHATLEAWNDDACRKIPGYLRAVRKGDFLAVVASNEWAAIRSATAIDATWSDWAGLPEQSELFQYIRQSEVGSNQVLHDEGEAPAPARATDRSLAATYTLPFNTHGSIGPSCAVARFENGLLTVWTPSQASHLLRKQLATLLALDDDKVHCIYVEGAGCYGRNGSDDCSSEAALIAMEIGKPVRLQWMREDEHGWDPKGPPTLMDYSARVDEQGHIADWNADIYLPERPTNRSGVTLLTAVLAKLPRFGPPDESGIYKPGLGLPYTLRHSRLVGHWLIDTPLPAAWIRAPGRMQNTFGNECFLDEVAALMKLDPFAIRRRYLKDARGLELLDRLETMAKWQPRGTRPHDSGDILRGRGVSYTKYELIRTHVGIVADVAVERSTGRIHVERVFVVHDCGQIINPDGLRNQVEGNIVQATSRTLVEELTFSRSAVTSVTWGSYPILTFPEVPQVHIELIDRPDEVPWGAGEPTTSVVPSAISNAVFDATGARLRSLPFRPDTVLAALAAAAHA